MSIPILRKFTYTFGNSEEILRKCEENFKTGNLRKLMHVNFLKLYFK